MFIANTTNDTNYANKISYKNKILIRVIRDKRDAFLSEAFVIQLILST
jgi:hypothetical protein